jgi:hypothetical protein
MLNGDVLTQEILALMGGKVTKERQKAFQKLCQGIIEHIQKYAIVTTTGVVAVTGVTPGPGAAAGTCSSTGTIK